MNKKQINEHIYVGELNTLAVNRVSEPGIYLISDDQTEVLLPNAYVTKSMDIGTFLDVFIYTDSEVVKLFLHLLYKFFFAYFLELIYVLVIQCQQMPQIS